MMLECGEGERKGGLDEDEDEDVEYVLIVV